MPRTIDVDYEEIHIVLARPSIADGLLRRKIWSELRRLVSNDNPAEHQFTTLFGAVITQIQTCEGLNLQKLTVYPGDDELLRIYESFKNQVDEMLVTLLENTIAPLNGYDKTVEDLKKKVVSATSSSSTSETENPTPVQ